MAAPPLAVDIWTFGHLLPGLWQLNPPARAGFASRKCPNVQSATKSAFEMSNSPVKCPKSRVLTFIDGNSDSFPVPFTRLNFGNPIQGNESFP